MTEAWKKPGVLPLVAEIRDIAADADRLFGQLSTDQLAWSPGPGRWSVAQCLEHLIRIDRAYWPVFARIEAGSYRSPLVCRLFLPGLWGALILKAVEPGTTMKARTSRPLDPASADVGGDVLRRFAAHEKELGAHMEAIDRAGGADAVIASPLLNAIGYRVLDALRILVAHQRRHLAQAQRVMAEASFPGGGQGDTGTGPSAAGAP